MIRFLFILSFVFTSMFARLNPFEPSDGANITTEDPKPIPVSNVKSINDGKRTVKIVSDEKAEKTEKKVQLKELKQVPFEKKVVKEPVTENPQVKAEKPTEKPVEKQIEKKEAHEEQPLATHTEVSKPKELKKSAPHTIKNKKITAKKIIIKKTQIKKNLKIAKPVKNRPAKVTQKEHQVSAVEQRNVIPTIENAIRYNVLPLLTIDLLDKNLTIQTSGNYKLIKYYADHTDKKFVFDFKAKISVPNTKDDFKSTYFKSYTVGNHLENGFFRVVIPALDDLSNYKVEIKNNVGIITHN